MITKKTFDVNIVFVGNQRIRSLNKKYLGKDVATDVIAFSNLKGQEPRIKGQVKVLGDIAISLDQAMKNSKIYDTEFFEEVVLYVIHGILHLFGYEDTNKEKRSLMKKQENEIFGKIRKFI